MPGDYSSQIATALRLISAKGAPITLRLTPPTGPATQDRIRGTVTATGAVEYRVSAVAVPIRLPRASATGGGQGGSGLVLQDMRTVYIAGAGWTLNGAPVAAVLPHKDDQILGLEGANWTIEVCTGLAPSSGPYIMFTARVTK